MVLRDPVTLVGGVDRLKPQRNGREGDAWQAALQLWLDALFGPGSGWSVKVKDRPEGQRGPDPAARTVWRHDVTVTQPGVKEKHRTLLVPLQAASRAGMSDADLEALAARISALPDGEAQPAKPRAKRRRKGLEPASPALRRGGEETAIWLRGIAPSLSCLDGVLSRLRGRRLALRHFAALAAAHQGPGAPHTLPAFLMVADLLGITTPVDIFNFTRALHALGAP